MKNILRLLILPSEISDFERSYLERLNRIALIFFAIHVPIFTLIAWLNDTGPLTAVILTSLVLVGPALARVSLTSPRSVSIVHGISAMFMGGLLVHFGQGPVQIEMHFYFFALIAMCAVFGNPLVIVAAAITVTLHHLLIWMVLPRSVFNYDAAWWVVGVHAVFVVLESVATCFISRSFFDNVIGLEKIVEARTQALDEKNQDMRVLLDNMQQGILTIDAQGKLSAERSRAIEQWLGAPAQGASWFDYLETVSPEIAASTRFAWEEVVAGIMPLELTLDQLPHRVAVDGKELQVDYRPIGATEPHQHYLVIVTDVTSEVAREHAETERREAMAVFERVLTDRSGFETFLEEGANTVDALTAVVPGEPAVVKRLIHTLKGNASLFDLRSIAKLCHTIEDFIAEAGAMPDMAAYRPLVERWSRLASDVERIMGRGSSTVQLDEVQYAGLIRALEAGESTDQLLRRVRLLKLEPAEKRLQHFAQQAHRIADSLEKGDLEVRIEDNGVRLDPKRWGGFWSSFIHAVRNALDHGIETADERVAAGKRPNGLLELRTEERADGLVIEIVDDGRGIDWKAVAERAARLGVPCETPAEVRRALFAEGVSTAENVTDLSGRGVGMGSLLHATRALGGELSVESTAGAGTRLSMTFADGARWGTSVAATHEPLAPAA